MIGNEPRIEEKPNQKASLKGHKNQKISLSSKEEVNFMLNPQRPNLYETLDASPRSAESEMQLIR